MDGFGGGRGRFGMSFACSEGLFLGGDEVERETGERISMSSSSLRLSEGSVDSEPEELVELPPSMSEPDSSPGLVASELSSSSSVLCVLWLSLPDVVRSSSPAVPVTLESRRRLLTWPSPDGSSGRLRLVATPRILFSIARARDKILKLHFSGNQLFDY